MAGSFSLDHETAENNTPRESGHIHMKPVQICEGLVYLYPYLTQVAQLSLGSWVPPWEVQRSKAASFVLATGRVINVQGCTNATQD